MPPAIFLGHYQHTGDEQFRGLKSFLSRDPLSLPAEHRLAFRELGLSIGLHAIALLHHSLRAEGRRSNSAQRLASRAERFMTYLPLAKKIESFCLEQAHRQSDSWTAHHDIYQVMLATSLVPHGYLQS